MSPTRVVASLLAIRDWATSILSGAPAADAERHGKRIHSIPAPVWRLFLSLERCAIPLVERMSPSAVDHVDAPLRELFQEIAARDMQTVLEARHVAAEVDAVARETGVQIAVIKGALRAITGEKPVLPVVDLDVLVRPEHIDRVSAALESHGIGAPRAEAIAATAHHLTFASSPERLPVELHWSLSATGAAVDAEVWSRVHPLGHGTVLTMLSPADQLAHLLDHALFQHADQSVTLRDALLIGAVAAECSEAERKISIKTLGPYTEAACRDLVAFGLDLYSARAGVSSDPMRGSAALWYAAVVLARRLPATLRSDSLLRYVSMAALGRTGIFAAARDAMRYRGTSSVILVAVRRKAPRAGAVIAGAAHLVWYGALGAVIYPAVALTARRASRLADAGQPVN